ncbi:MAG: NfeD family protein [Paracoccaceae bacterium]
MSGSAFFAEIAAIPPWYWFAFGVLLLAAEILAPAFILIWPGFAAMIVALVVWLVPGLSGEVITIGFALLALALTFAGRAMFNRTSNDVPTTGLNARTGGLVGRRAKVISFNQGEGHVEVGGVQWPAAWPEGATAEVGDMVKIKAVDGVRLVIEA